jgi:hypothetical protein
LVKATGTKNAATTLDCGAAMTWVWSKPIGFCLGMLES